MTDWIQEGFVRELDNGNGLYWDVLFFGRYRLSVALPASRGIAFDDEW